MYLFCICQRWGYKPACTSIWTCNGGARRLKFRGVRVKEHKVAACKSWGEVVEGVELGGVSGMVIDRGSQAAAHTT